MYFPSGVLIMLYINKTLIEGEKIIAFERMHWIFWLSWFPIFFLISFSISFVYLLMSLFPNRGGAFISSIFLLGSFIGLLCYFIKYISVENVVTSERVFYKTGFITVDTDELRNKKIENIQIKQSILGRIIGYGDLEFKGVGGSSIIFRSIKNPISMKKTVEKFLFQ